MTIQTLESALERGLGRAVLLTEKYYTTEFRETILHACLHFVGWDVQMEDSRAPYLMDVIHATGEPQFYEEAILAALENPKEEYYEGQLIELACLITRLGNEQAREIVYRAVERRFARGSHWYGSDLIELDGLTGFAFVASLFIRYSPLHTIYAEEDYVHLNRLEEQFGEEGVPSAISQVIAMHPELKAHCLDALERWKANNAKNAERRANKPPQPPLTYEEVRQVMVQKVKRRSYHFYGRHLTPDAAERFAQEALDATEPHEQARLLSLFAEREFPLPVEPLLPLANASDERLRASAIRALAFVKHPAIRALALQLAEIPGREADALRLFIRNSIREDASLFLLLAQRIDDEQIQHRFSMVLRDLYEEHPHPALTPTLLHLYENGPCSFCRGYIVESLLELGALSESLRRECRYDANKRIRELVTTLE